MSPKRCLLASAAILAGSLLIYNGINGSKAIAEKQEGDSKQRPKIDLAFCIDTTGSMQGEIDAVKSKTKEIVAKLSSSKPAPDIRVGLVAFRDRGDEYVTKVFQFSDNIDQVVKDISSLNADGGGDEPEAVNEALHSSVSDLSWSKDKKAVKLLFLIGDAGPSSYPNDYNWEAESKNAISQGIQINTIACGGMASGSSAHDVFQTIAKLADGKSEFLTYRQEIVDANGEKTTMVASGGKMYKVDRKAASHWREGADSLMASGAAAPMAAPSGGYYSSASAGAPAAPSALFGASAGRSVLAGRMRGGGGGGGGAAGGFAALPSASTLATESSDSFGDADMAAAAMSRPMPRSESNLDDIVLGAAKEAAKKKANLEYKD